MQGFSAASNLAGVYTGNGLVIPLPPLLVFPAINNPDASVGVCCSHKVVAVGFNTLHYDANVGVLTLRTNKRYGYLRENT